MGMVHSITQIPKVTAALVVMKLLIYRNIPEPVGAKSTSVTVICPREFIARCSSKTERERAFLVFKKNHIREYSMSL